MRMLDKIEANEVRSVWTLKYVYTLSVFVSTCVFNKDEHIRPLCCIHMHYAQCVHSLGALQYCYVIYALNIS